MTRAPLLPAADPIEHLPVLMLEVCEICGCRCRMCDLWRPNPIVRGEGGRAPELDLDLLRSWLPGWQALGVGRVGLTGGEPLLHTRIEDLLEMLGCAGFSLTLMTAGTGLDHHAGAVARRCDAVVVSLDGPPEIHDAVRRAPDSFANLEAGVEALRAESDELLRITARCTVQRANLGHLVRTVETARALGLDAISFLPVETSVGTFDRSHVTDEIRRRNLCPGIDEIDALAVELDAVARERTTNDPFVAEDREALRERVLDHFRAEAGLEVHRARPCNAPWVSAVVDIDGTVQPCFFHSPYGRLDRGVNLSELVNAVRARGQRRELDVIDNKICRRCVCPLALRAEEDPG